ncbi:hypothetical protein ACEPAH_1193 [Sanghuangporus vaninii]
MKLTTLAAALALLTGSVSAHTIFQKVYINGPIKVSLSVLEHQITMDPSLTLHPTTSFATEGQTHLHTFQTSAGTNDPADPIDSSHKGPIISYLAQIPDATQSDVSGLKWFKIYEDGLDTSSGQWAVDKLIANEGKATFNLPSCIPAGQYLLRHEIIALHAASSYPGAQFYMECAQLEITGGGSASPATISFPGAYQGSDPGITINIYQNLSNYTIPGPAVFSC